MQGKEMETDCRSWSISDLSFLEIDRVHAVAGVILGWATLEHC